MTFTVQDLERDFRALGVKKGDMIYLHSSLKSVGTCENGADTVIDALLAVLGEEGTLAVPTHTYSVPGNGRPPFSVNEPSVVGHLTNVLRQRPGAVRSRNATHSSAAIGKYANELMENHCMSHALDTESPIARMVKRGGKILLLGVGHTSNTTIHLAETLSEAGYTTVPFSGNEDKMAHYMDENQKEVFVKQTEILGCSQHFGVMEGILKLAGITRYGQVGDGAGQLMAASEVVDQTVEILRQKPDFLLCYNPGCPICGSRRKFLKKLNEDG